MHLARAVCVLRLSQLLLLLLVALVASAVCARLKERTRLTPRAELGARFVDGGTLYRMGTDIHKYIRQMRHIMRQILLRFQHSGPLRW